MLSSHNIYKQSEMVEDKRVKKIQTDYVIKKKEPVYFDSEGNIALKDHDEENIIITEHQKLKMREFNKEIEIAKSHLKKVFKRERDKFFSELRLIKEQVIEQAKLEGEELKKEAYQEGLKEGQIDGYESGLENGYQAGEEKANHLKENSLKVIKQAEEQMTRYKKENQHEFIELAAEMAEMILGKELSQSEMELQILLEPVLNRLDKNDNFITIFVRKENQEQTSNYMNELKECYPEMKFAVIVDDALEKNGCVIETNYELIDLQLKKQLDLMVKELTKGE